MKDIDVIKKDLRENLSEYRYKHSVAVAEVAVELANIYGVDTRDAYVAGLLHDVAKEFSDKKKDFCIKKYGIPKKYLNKGKKKVLHAYIGASYAKDVYGVSDDIAHAIMVHTTAALEMNMLDKILYVADKIEPNREHLGVEEERRLAYINIDEALAMCLYMNIIKRLAKGKEISKDALSIVKRYCKTRKKKNSNM